METEKIIVQEKTLEELIIEASEGVKLIEEKNCVPEVVNSAYNGRDSPFWVN